VEDDAMLANVLLEKLSKNGYEAIAVASGLEVLEKAKTFKPYIILLDLILPGLDGFEVLKQLKNDNETKAIPVFVISNLDSLPDVKSVKALGAEEYFIKANVKIDNIIGAVNKRVK